MAFSRASKRPVRKFSTHEKINLRSWLALYRAEDRAAVLVKLPIKEVARLDYKITGRSFSHLIEQPRPNAARGGRREVYS